MWRIILLSIQGFKKIGKLANRKKPAPRGKLATSIVPVLLLAMLLPSWIASHAAHAQVNVQSNTAVPGQGVAGPNLLGVAPVAANGLVAAPVPGAVVGSGMDTGLQARQVPAGQFDNIFSLADVSSSETIVLRGVDAYHSVYFSIPQTQLVKTAVMKLQYHFSPGLLPMISHLKVSLNGTLFATIPVVQQPSIIGTEQNDLTPEQKISSARAENNALMVATLVMPAEMLVHSNELTFEFIGHYTMQCEDPSHSTLWAHVDSTTTLELAGVLLPLQNDLKLLPLPFYDAAVNLHPSVPIVFLSQPSPKTLQAAGIVASWFGILTDYRPVRFPVSLGNIPQGNVIVISDNAQELPASLSVAGSSGPTVAMRTNPSDPYSKVLLLTGGNPDELVTAARALTLMKDSGQLSGDVQRLSITSAPAKSEPDEAPRWMRTDKNTPIGDISQQGDLQGDGSVPVGIYMRVPPDLYYGAKQNLAFQLYYRYNGIPLANESSLQVYMNQAYISSTPMPHTEKASANLSTIVPVPVVDMRPFSNTMLMKFIFQIAKKGHCQDTAPLNLQGAIVKDSFLDIRGIPHWATLPNLEIFANAGYPFTRRADLSDSAVVMPASPQPEEIELYLTLMGHFGAQTGYPVLNVEVTDADGMKQGGKDYLVLGTVDDSPAIGKLNDNLPVKMENGGLHIQDTEGYFDPLQHAWWKVKSSDHVETGRLETAGGMPDAVVEGIEWPRGTNHSVVMVALKDKTVVSNFLAVFLKTSQSSDISQSVSVLNGNRFISYRIGNEVYHVGTLGLLIRISLLFSEFPWLVVAGAALLCFLMAALIRAMLRRHARSRLQANE